MAQPANTYSSYDMVGIREDLRDAIYTVDPEETPWLSSIKKSKAKQRYHEWQTDTLRASADNANLEGDDIVPNAINPTTRLGNYVQIMTESATVTDTDQSLDKAGRAKEMAYQIRKKVKEMKLDAERALFLNQAKVAGSNTTVPRFAGAQSWFKASASGGNVSFGVGGSAATGDGTDIRTDGTDRPLTQPIFDTVMQSCWDNSGGQPRDVYLSSGQMNVCLGFTGMNNQRATITTNKSTNNAVVKAFDVYVTQWGTVTFKMSRECPSTELFIIDPKMWEVAELRGMRNFPLAKTGMSEKRAMDWEWTLVAKNQGSSGMIADLS